VGVALIPDYSPSSSMVHQCGSPGSKQREAPGSSSVGRQGQAVWDTRVKQREAPGSSSVGHQGEVA